MTRTNKFFAITTAALVVAIALTSNFAKAFDLTKAASTLPSNDEWSVMAKAAIGQTSGQDFLRSQILSTQATDYEKRILAITAIGANPRNYSSIDLVAKLESFFDGTQIGDSTLLNDDIFGILALKSASISDTAVNQSRQFLLNHENSDGGFGYATNVGSDSNTTAMAIAALSETGGAPSAAFDYLSHSQNSDGGYGFMPGVPSDGASTAWAIMGLNSAGRAAPTNAKNFLQSLQLSDGSFKWKPSDTTGSAIVTAYSIIALSGHGLPIKTVSASAATNSANTVSANPDTSSSFIVATTNSAINNPLTIPQVSPQTYPSDCLVPIFHTNFAFPAEGGKIVEIAGQKYFVKTYESACANAGNGGTTIQHNSTNNSVNIQPVNNFSDSSGSVINLDDCLVPIFHTNFAFPAEGGKIVQIDGQMYFAKTYEAGCANAGSAGATVLPNPANINTFNTSTSSDLGQNPSPTQTINVSVSYLSTRIFSSQITFMGQTALSALTQAAQQSGYATNVSQTALGQYVSSIAGYPASGSSGWQYAVNGSTPNVPAASYSLHPGDNLQWFFGPAGSSPY